jgi:F-type H+-transporting ATPase subunit delta
MSLLSNQMLGVAERAGALERLFRGRVSDLLLRFLLVMNRKGRLDRLPGVLDAFGHELLALRGVVEVEVHLAAELDQAQAWALAQRLSAHLGREVLLHQKLDAELIGGIKLRIGDRLVDGSVAAQLRQLKNRLSKVRG